MTPIFTAALLAIQAHIGVLSPSKLPQKVSGLQQIPGGGLDFEASKLQHAGRSALAAEKYLEAAKVQREQDALGLAADSAGGALFLCPEGTPTSRRAIRILNSILRQTQPYSYIRVYILDFAEGLESLGRIDEMEMLIDPILNGVPKGLAFAKACRIRALAATDANDFPTAQRLLEKDDQITSKLAPDSIQYADCLVARANLHNNLAALYFSSLDAQEEGRLLHVAQAILEKEAPNSGLMARIYCQQAYDSASAGALVKAETFLGAARNIVSQSNEDPSTYGLFCMVRSIVSDAEGKPLVAAQWRNTGFTAMKHAAPTSANMAALCEAAAITYQARGDLKNAQLWFNLCAPFELAKWPHSTDTASTFSNLGVTEAQAGLYKQAIRHLLIASKILQFNMEASPGVHARELMEKHQYVQPEALVYAYLATGEVTDAFQVSNSRGQVTTYWYRQHSFDPFEYANAGQRKAKEAIIGDLLGAQHALVRANSPEKSAVVDKRLTDLSLQLGDLTNAAVAEHPYPHLNDSAYDLAQSQKALDPGTLLMQYVISDAGPMLFTLSRNSGSLRGYRLPISTGQLQSLSASYQQAVANRGDFLQQGHALYQLLIEPARAEIDKCKRILLCPQGFLDTLPFNALVRSATGVTLQKTSKVVQQASDPNRGMKGSGPKSSKTFEIKGDVSYFGDEKPMHRTLSVEFYDLIRKEHRRQSSIPFVGFGRPEYKGALPDLEGTESEILEPAKSFGGVSLTGEQASVANLLKLGSKAKILHIACHGEAFASQPSASALLLAVEGNDIGVVNEFDIRNQLKLSADLVVLSACESGLGEIMQSEGVDGFIKVLQYAGAKSVVSSLWSVADQSTSEYMKQFYARLLAGDTKDVAIEKAGEAIRAKYPHPFYWAPFVLDGDYK